MLRKALIEQMVPVDMGAMSQSLRHRVDCPICMGGRIAPYPSECPRCDGRGWVWYVAADDVEIACALCDLCREKGVAVCVCGRRLKAVCSSCGDALPNDARFCIACGTAVAAIGETERL